MLLVGCAGTILITGWLPVMSLAKQVHGTYFQITLFQLFHFFIMGNFASKAGMSEALFKFAGACLVIEKEELLWLQ